MRKLIEFLVSYTKIEFAYVFRGKNRIRELVSKDGHRVGGIHLVRTQKLNPLPLVRKEQ
jgi:hypothetical protein